MMKDTVITQIHRLHAFVSSTAKAMEVRPLSGLGNETWKGARAEMHVHRALKWSMLN
jgi:hypothetical protein